jgi:ribose transport system substrate-binding protein
MGLLLAAAFSAASSARPSAAGSDLAAQACGQDVTFKTKDPDKVLKTLPQAARKQYGTWPYDVRATPWKTFAGIKPPWKIGFISYPIGIPWQASLLKGLKREFAKAKAKGLVTGSLVTSIQPSMATATPEQQIAAIQQMVRDGVNGILVSPYLTTPLGPAIDEAGKNNVPVVVLSNVIPNSKYVINVWSNNNSPAAAGVAGLVRKGNVLIVRGIPGNTVEQAFQDAAVANIKACPGLKVVGTVWGKWTNVTAKTEVIKYLASHPGQQIDAVVQHGGMMPGIVDAFQSSGRTVPPIANGNASGGDLSWWLARKAKYKTVGTTFTGAMTAYTELRLLFRVLGGKGPKVRDISFLPAVITNANLAGFATPNKPLSWTGEPRGPLNGWCSNTCMDNYFVKPGTPGGF